MSENILLEKRNDINIKKASRLTDKILIAWKIYSGYEEHWIKMKDIVKGHNIHMTVHGTIIAVNELKNLNTIDMVLNEIRDNPETISTIKEYAKNGIDSLDTSSYEKEIEKRIYTTFMRILPEYCRQKASKDFIVFMKNPKNMPLIKEMFNVHGIALNTEKDIDEIVHKMLNR